VTIYPLLVLIATAVVAALVPRPRWTARWALQVTTPLLAAGALVVVLGPIRRVAPPAPGEWLLLIFAAALLAWGVVSDPGIRRWWRMRRDAGFRFDANVYAALTRWEALARPGDGGSNEELATAGHRLMSELRSFDPPDSSWAAIRDDYVQWVDERCAMLVGHPTSEEIAASGSRWRALTDRILAMREAPKSERTTR
jgi:hypothetical protein